MSGGEMVMRRSGDRLLPVTERDREILLEIPDGIDLFVKTSRPRSPRQHRLFMALLQLVVDNHPHYTRPEQLLEWLKVRLGYVDETVWHDGKVWFKTQSISFASMGQDKFRQFFTLSVDAITQEVIPELDMDALLDEVSEMMGENVRKYVNANSVDASRDRQGSRTGEGGVNRSTDSGGSGK